MAWSSHSSTADAYAQFLGEVSNEYDTRTRSLPRATPVGAGYGPSLFASPDAVPLETALRAFIKSALPEFTVKSIEAVPSTRLHIQYAVKSIDHSTLRLTLPPPMGTRLMRVEDSSLRSEAIVLEWLSDLADRVREEVTVDAEDAKQSGVDRTKENPGGKAKAVQGKDGHLDGYLPKLVRHGPTNRLEVKGYILTRPTGGIPVSTLPKLLSDQERASVEFQTGQLLRRIALHQSPTKRFGPAGDVLLPTQTSKPSWMPGVRFQPQDGYESWPEAFHALLEAALCDAEANMLQISYHSIRSEFQRFKHFLNAVTKPCLVAVDAGDDNNTLVFRPKVQDRRAKEKTAHKAAAVKHVLPQDGRPEGELHGHEHVHDDGLDQDAVDTTSHGQIRVTGLQDWGSCLFGDPLMASTFSVKPSKVLWDGFRSAVYDVEPELSNPSWSPVQDKRNAHIRLLLYEMYHNITAIAREYHRRCSDSDDREMPARKRLIKTVAKLKELNSDGRPLRDRPRSESFAAKRPKPNHQDGGG